MLKKIVYNTKHKSELLHITKDIKEAVIESGVKNGIAVLFTPHTTASLFLFENNDPNLARDFLKKITDLVPHTQKYAHIGDNAHAHIKSGIVGANVNLIIEDASIILGQWQGIYLAEFDGPRNRDVFIKILG